MTLRSQKKTKNKKRAGSVELASPGILSMMRTTARSDYYFIQTNLYMVLFLKCFIKSCSQKDKANIGKNAQTSREVGPKSRNATKNTNKGKPHMQQELLH